MYNITFQQIETFLYIAKYLNLSKAAEAMYLSQPALSKTLHRFEEGLGLRLFNRGSKGVALTTEGAYLQSKLEPIYNSLNTTIDAAHRISDSRTKTIKIVEPSTFDFSESFNEVKEFIRKFEREYPDINILESLQDFKELRLEMRFGDIDFFVTQDFLLKGLQNISYRPISEFKMYIMMSSANSMANSVNLDFTQLNDSTVYRVAFVDDQYDRTLTSDLCAKIGFLPKRIEFVPNFQTLFHKIQENKGISICSKFNYIKTEEEFRYFPLPPEIEKNNIVIAWHTDHLTPEMRTFVNLLPGDTIQLSNDAEFV